MKSKNVIRDTMENVKAIGVQACKKIKPGRFVRAIFEDVGAMDGLVIDNDQEDRLSMIFPYSEQNHAHYSQVVKVGAFSTSRYE